MNDLLNLPIYLQATLGCGYLAYIIARQGRRKNEKAYDVVLGTILCSIPGLGVWRLLEHFSFPLISTIVFMLVASALTGIVWRKYLRRFWFDFLNEARISTNDDNPSTWTRLIQDTTITPTQIVVYLKDGKRLYCDDVHKFHNSPIPTMQYDREGNIAMYVTHTQSIGKERKPAQHLQHDSWGDMISYVPSSEIARVKLRYKKVS